MPTGRDLVRSAFKRQPVPRVPWVPFVGSHGAFMLGKGASAYLKSADLLVQALTKAKDQYKADGMPVMFDLQLEAEVLGCELHWTEDGPPSVKTHPLELMGENWDLAKLPALDLSKGRFPVAFEATRRIRTALPDTAIYGLICGPFTLATHLLGNGLFLQMSDQPERIQALLDWCAGVCIEESKRYLQEGADIIAVVDPMLSQISPRAFKTFVTPAMKRLTDAIRAAGGLSSMFVCGDATRNLDNLCGCGADNVSVDENVDLAKLRAAAEKANVSFGGNIKLTVVLLLGKEIDAKKDVIRCLDAGGATGYVLAPGCDLPYNTPVANVAACGQVATDAYQLDVARKTAASAASDDFADIVPPKYAQEKQVILDVITLDSESCAPCQYMMIAAHKAAEKFPGKVAVREHKIKNRAGIGMLVKLGVQNLPTICIDGQQKFISIIPDHPTLVAEIGKAAKAKGLG